MDQSSSGPLSLAAPVTGVVVPLEEVPDAVFAQRLVGDGISIDPTGRVLVAPCDAKVTNVHRAKHAVSLEARGGVTLLLHVGIDTVALKGEGFRTLVSEGESVRAGQALIEFDLDRIARHARSALTELIVTSGAACISARRTSGSVMAGQEEVARLELGDAAATGDADAKQAEITIEHVLVKNPHGIHARPAARLAQTAKQFQAVVRLHHKQKWAPATSVSEVMTLDVRCGDRISLSASGAQARAALDAIKDAIAAGLGENLSSLPPEAHVEQRFESHDEGLIGGVPASPGLAIGLVRTKNREMPTFPPTAAEPAPELARLAAAIHALKERLQTKRARLERRGELSKAQIFSAHLEMLEDPSIIDEAQRSIQSGASAPAAWSGVYQQRARALADLSNPVMRARASDIDDIGYQVLCQLTGFRVPEPIAGYSLITVMVSEDLALSDLAELEPDSVGALITAHGGGSSHAAIIARSLGIPYVAGIGESLARLRDGQQVIVDGDCGSVSLDPSPSALSNALQEIGARRAARKQALSDATRLAVTKDGRAIEVGGNIGNVKDATQAVENGCDGIGLLRSEFLFLDRREAPTEDEQREQITRIARTLGRDRSLVVRTLDVGGDKPLPYLPLAPEENPFLGIRGLRFSLRHPELFRAQLRSTLAASAHTRLRIMFPMVARLDELHEGKRYVLSEAAALGIDPTTVEVGVMIEVPSAAVMADVLALEADFFSIGTNDLTQYVLAMDRGHPVLAAEADQLEPAVLRLIERTVDAAHARGKWVGMCGGLAAESVATPLLVGLGLDELSVPAPSIPELKKRIRELDSGECRALSKSCLNVDSAQSVRRLLAEFRRKQAS